jgi:hypothetical protein
MNSEVSRLPCSGYTVHSQVKGNRRQRHGIRLPMVTRLVLYRASRRMEMVNHLMDAPCTNDREASTPAGKIPTEWFSPVSDLSNPLISEVRSVSRCLLRFVQGNLISYRRGEPCSDAYGLELLRSSYCGSSRRRAVGD